MCKKHSRRLIAVIGFLAVWLACFFFRDMIASRDVRAMERATGAQFVPFLVESAIMESYINKVADGESIAGVDPALPAMAHRPVAEQMTLGLEYAGGWLIRARRALCGTPEAGEYERSYEETRFLRRSFTLFISLVPAFLYLMLLWLHVPWFIALLAALLEAVSAAAIGRYSGQDLIKGAFAFPFLAAYLAASAAALRSSFRARKLALVAVFLSAFAAAAFWDASQILIGALALMEVLRLVMGGAVSLKRRNLWLVTFMALALAALLPYQRAHGAFFSPVLEFALPAAFLLNWIPFNTPWLPAKRLGVAAALLVWSLVLAKLSPFAGNYSHFSDLLMAKLRFWNTLPPAPAALTFDQRFLWTPELHSADTKFLAMVFPFALPVFLLWLGWVGIRWKKLRAKRRYAGSFRLFTLLTLVGIVTTIYFVRFRDVTMLMATPALGLAAALFFAQGKRAWRWVPVALLALLLALETHNSVILRRAYPEGLKATAELIKHLRKFDLQGKVVLSDMQTSPLLKCYANAAILIQPKYELPEVRILMRNYLEIFFCGSIAQFEKFCADHRVDYVVVHCPMVTTPMSEPYSYRYMTCTNQLRLNSAAAVLGMGADGMAKHFSEVPIPQEATGLQGYRVYKFVSPDRRKEAEALAEEAMEAYYLGNQRKARSLIRKAYAIAPGQGSIYENFITICRALPPAPSLPKRKAEK